MQPEGHVAPELDSRRQHAKTRPMRRPGYLADAEFHGVFRHRLLQGEAALQRAGLARCPGADPAPAGAAGVICVGLGLRHRLHLAFHANGAGQAFPVKEQRGMRICGQFHALAAFEIGVEDETARIDTLEKDHSGTWPSIGRAGRQAHGIGVIHLRGRGLGHPFGEDRIGVSGWRGAHAKYPEMNRALPGPWPCATTTQPLQP